MPKIAFVIGGRSFVLSAEDYTLRPIPNSTTTGSETPIGCVSGFRSTDGSFFLFS